MYRMLNADKRIDKAEKLLRAQKYLDSCKDLGETFSGYAVERATHCSVEFLRNNGLIKYVCQEDISVLAEPAWHSHGKYNNTVYAFDLETKEIVPMSKLQSGGTYGIAKGLVRTVSRYTYRTVFENLEELKDILTEELENDLNNAVSFIETY